MKIFKLALLSMMPLVVISGLVAVAVYAHCTDEPPEAPQPSPRIHYEVIEITNAPEATLLGLMESIER